MDEPGAITSGLGIPSIRGPRLDVELTILVDSTKADTAIPKSDVAGELIVRLLSVILENLRPL